MLLCFIPLKEDHTNLALLVPVARSENKISSFLEPKIIQPLLEAFDLATLPLAESFYRLLVRLIQYLGHWLEMFFQRLVQSDRAAGVAAVLSDRARES